jgi:hypothetical protein
MSSSPISGKLFNETYKNKNFFKFTFAHGVHHGMTYTDGENIDINVFNENNDRTGLYFFETTCAFSHYKLSHTHIRKVIIPDDAFVIVRNNSFRANKFILGPSEMFGSNLDLVMEFIKLSNYQPTLVFYNKLKDIVPVGEIDFLEMLISSSNINDKFDDLKLSDETISKLILKYPKTINNFEKISLINCKNALELDGTLLRIVNKHTTKIAKFLKDNKTFSDFNSIIESLDNLNSIAVNQTYKAIEFIDKPTDEQYITAFTQSKETNKFVKSKLSKNVAEFVLALYPSLITNSCYSDGITEKTAINIIINNPQYLKLINPELQTEEICKIALSNDITTCKYINDKFMYLITTTF